MTVNPRIQHFFTFPFAFWDNFFTEDELKAIEIYCADQGTEESAIEKGITDKSIRNSNIRMIYSNSENEWIFSKLIGIAGHMNTQFYNYDLNGFDHFQYTEYDGEGTEYKYHTDAVFGGDVPVDLLIPRKLSFSLVLSDSSEYQGGELEFMISSGDPLVAEQKRGRIIAFPSYMLHRIAPLKSGKRRSIVFWAVGPKFK